MNKEDVTVYAVSQGLYEIAVKDTAWGRIQNWKGQWWAYPIDSPQVKVCVTHSLHKDIEAEIARAFNGQGEKTLWQDIEKLKDEGHISW